MTLTVVGDIPSLSLNSHLLVFALNYKQAINKPVSNVNQMINLKSVSAVLWQIRAKQKNSGKPGVRAEMI